MADGFFENIKTPKLSSRVTTASVMQSQDMHGNKRQRNRSNLVGTLATIDSYCNEKLTDNDLKLDVMRNIPKSLLNKMRQKDHSRFNNKMYMSMRNSP